MLQLHEAHPYSENLNIFQEYLQLLSDPAHWMFEITVSIAFDLLIVALLYGIVFKRLILPKIKKQISDDVHKSHGIADEHCDNSIESQNKRLDR